jgi:hypothetical protein
MALGFIVETVAALVERPPISFGFWSWIAAGETAAWRLKWIAIPISFVVVWGGRRVYRSMLQQPARFVGMKAARRGVMASAFVILLIATLIGVTVPDRLRQRQFRLQAITDAQKWTVQRAELEYLAVHGTVAATPLDLLELPDPDGSIAAALSIVDPAFYKTSGADIAVASPKSRNLPGAVVRNASLGSPAEDSPAREFSATSYEFRLPGPDKLFGTDDDVIVRDGVTQDPTVKGTPIPPKATVRPSKR